MLQHNTAQIRIFQDMLREALAHLRIRAANIDDQLPASVLPPAGAPGVPYAAIDHEHPDYITESELESAIEDALATTPPAAHAASHASGGSDAISPASIGAATAAALAQEILDRAAAITAHETNYTASTSAKGHVQLAAHSATTAGRAVQASDPRLSDARTATAHAASHATGGTDPISPASIGAAAASHQHSAADINTGTISIDRLPVAASGSGSPVTIVGSLDSRLNNARTPTSHASTHASGGPDHITPLSIGAAEQSHGHAITDLPVALSGVSSSTQLVRADDARLSNTRTATAHAASHASGGSDAISPASIGAAAASHQHSAADLTSGTLADARLSANVARRDAANTYTQAQTFNAAQLDGAGRTIRDAGGGWVRTHDATGIYFESGGGGLYMPSGDSTWIRTFGAKGLLSTGMYNAGPHYVERGGAMYTGYLTIPITPATVSGWSNANKPITGWTAIDLSSAGVPAAARGVFIRISGQPSSSANQNHFIGFGPDGANTSILIRAATTIYQDALGFVPCNGSGQIYYTVSGQQFNSCFLVVSGYIV